MGKNTAEYSVHKVSFLNFIATVFENFRLFFIQIIFIYEVGKCPRITPAAAPLQISYGFVAIAASQKYQFF